jgi:uncharacterized protein YeaC (DUF1315 family)
MQYKLMMSYGVKKYVEEEHGESEMGGDVVMKDIRHRLIQYSFS